jgi:hypothetical protein
VVEVVGGFRKLVMGGPIMDVEFGYAAEVVEVDWHSIGGVVV